MTAYIVLGMHRSGTSLIASMMHEMGVPMGDPLQEPDEYNPHGYWEDVIIKDLNKQLLDAAGGSWEKLVTRKAILAAMPPFLDRMGEVAKERGNKRVGVRWGFKDPRTCLTIWAWERVVEDARYIVVHRNKGAIINSLKRTGRDGPWNKLYQHYWNHIRSFIGLNPGKPFFHISFEDLIDSRFQVPAAIGLAEFIGSAGQARNGLKMIKLNRS